MRLLSLLTMMLLLIASGCERESKAPISPSPLPSPSPSATPLDPKVKAALSEAATIDSLYQHFPKVDLLAPRQAASALLKSELPDWTLKGLSTEPYESNIFWIDADIEKGNRRRVISLLVKEFYPEDGSPAYWKAFPVDRIHAARLHDLRDISLQHQLDDANEKVNSYENGERP
jgi:hypothetical protein